MSETKGEANVNEKVREIVEKARALLQVAKERERDIPKSKLREMIDHTLLKPETREDNVRDLLSEAVQHRFWGICIPPVFLPLISKDAEREGIRAITVVGFPLGYVPSDIKVKETTWSVEQGAQEIDMVLNIGRVKEGRYDEIEREIERVAKAAEGRVVKVILETALLEDEEKVMAAWSSRRAGASFVKTSTGFGPGGATPWDVALLKAAVGEDMGVKASGGIRTYEQARLLIATGATRIGTSRSLNLIREAPEP